MERAPITAPKTVLKLSIDSDSTALARSLSGRIRATGTGTGSVNVIIFALDGATDGTGGADHNGCDYVVGNNLEVCAAFGTPMRVSALFEAELSECNIGGNLCGVSTGEALSRWCSASLIGPLARPSSRSGIGAFPSWSKHSLEQPLTIDTEPERGVRRCRRTDL